MEEDCLPWVPRHLSDALTLAESRGSPVSFRMAAIDYADIRKFGRDALDVETRADIWKTGRMGVIFNLPLTVHREAHKGVVEVIGHGDLVLSHRSALSGVLTRSHPGPFSGCQLCSVSLVLRS